VRTAQSPVLECCHAVWIGDRLGPQASACLRSFVRAGHRLVLHAYDAIEDVPAGVELADAARIVPRERIFRHAATGSYALFSDYFRYRILQRGLGLYVDCDVVCVRPLVARGDYVFGYQDARTINGAVLKLPAESAMLRELLALFEQPVFAPPWFRRARRLGQHLKHLIGLQADLAHAAWGAAGPNALTWLAGEHGVRDRALSPEAYYPVPFEQAARFLDAGESWESLVTERTLCVHLWNEMLRRESCVSPPPGSPLQRLIDGEWPLPVRARAPAAG
jgi:hypothetical protein